MKKRIFAFIFSLMLCLLSVLPVFAVVERPLHIIDDMLVFREDEFNELEDMAAALESKYGYCVMFCVTDKVQENHTYEYGQTQYANNSLAQNGIALIHNTQAKQYAFYVSGQAEAVFTDGVQDNLWEAYNDTETYFDGVVAYLETAEFVLETSGVSAAVTQTPSKNASGEVTVDPNLPTERLLPLVVDQADLLSDE